MQDKNVISARRFTLAAIVFQLFIFSIAFYAYISVLVLSKVDSINLGVLKVSPLAALGLLMLWVVWAPLNYFLIYRPLRSGKAREAKLPSLVLGIIQLVFGALIIGILLLSAYGDIGDSLNGNGQGDQLEA